METQNNINNTSEERIHMLEDIFYENYANIRNRKNIILHTKKLH